jgi:hypothetical protein
MAGGGKTARSGRKEVLLKETPARYFSLLFSSLTSLDTFVEMHKLNCGT